MAGGIWQKSFHSPPSVQAVLVVNCCILGSFMVGVMSAEECAVPKANMALVCLLHSSQ